MAHTELATVQYDSSSARSTSPLPAAWQQTAATSAIAEAARFPASIASEAGSKWSAQTAYANRLKASLSGQNIVSVSYKCTRMECYLTFAEEIAAAPKRGAVLVPVPSTATRYIVCCARNDISRRSDAWINASFAEQSHLSALRYQREDSRYRQHGPLAYPAPPALFGKRGMTNSRQTDGREDQQHAPLSRHHQ